MFLLIAECGANEFKCKSDHLCIPLSRVSDNVRDCADGSDERCEDGSESLNSKASGCMSNELFAGKLNQH